LISKDRCKSVQAQTDRKQEDEIKSYDAQDYFSGWGTKNHGVTQS
jgi:hypothetical protein